MKTLTALLLVFGSAFFAAGQVLIQHLDFNNTNATLTNSGIFFRDPTAGAGYEVPKGGGVNAIFAGNFWFAASDGSGNLFTTLGGNGNNLTDIDPGPFSSTNDYGDPSYDNFFMISLCQDEIDQFIAWWDCMNGPPNPACGSITQPTADVLGAIYAWPGSGNPALGQSPNLAPYVDKDANGSYNPTDGGDYPIIKGCCATYIIQNDVGNNHTFSNTAPMGIEMHYMFYHYGANDLLFHSTFVDVMAINKSGVNYPSFAQGFYLDADLGFYGDDFFGSDSLNNMMYFYNADNADENGYGANPPAIGIVALENTLTSAIPYQSGSAWNQLNGLMPSGAPFLDANGNATKFVYSGNPNSSTGWNETNAGNIGGDRRGLMSTAMGALNAGDTAIQTYAIIYSRVGTNVENAEHLSSLAQEAKAFYDSGADGCDAGGFAGISEIIVEEVLVYPNPSNGEFLVSFPNGEIQKVELFTMTGSVVAFAQHVNGSVLRIDMQDKASGVYLMQIATDRGTIRKRVIVE